MAKRPLRPFVHPSAADRARLVAALSRLAPTPGRHASAWPGLRCFRAEQPTAPDPTVYRPALCVVAQGAKEAFLGEHGLRYDPLHYLVIGVAMPVHARIVEASPERPFLSLLLDLVPREIRELTLDLSATASEEPDERGSHGSWGDQPPIRVSPLDGPLLAAVVRLLEAIDTPTDRRVLAPAAQREIFYRALLGEQGELIRGAARTARASAGVERALRYIHRHLEHRVDVATLAREAGMSASAFHQGFKSVTTLSPVQYVKRIRLDRARQLLVDEGCQAAEAAWRVGYESASQFSREFKRCFGASPRRYREQQVALAAATN
jgi:AraC-like DNA-binding protein